MNTATAKRLYGINAFVAWLGYGMVQVVNIFGLVPRSTPYDPGSNLFGGHAEGLAGPSVACMTPTATSPPGPTLWWQSP